MVEIEKRDNLYCVKALNEDFCLVETEEQANDFKETLLKLMKKQFFYGKIRAQFILARFLSNKGEKTASNLVNNFKWYRINPKDKNDGE